MQVHTALPQLDAVLEPWRATIGDDFLAYRNHCCRMVNFCFALHPCSDNDQEKIMIAAAFHDIGIWTHHTLDYLPPSVPPAQAYLQEAGKTEWFAEIKAMIEEHHKLTPCDNNLSPLVEVFRRGDLVDFSRGLSKQGLPKAFIREVQATFPNAGFHRLLAKLASRWLIRHPLNPAPMMKW